MLKKVLPLIIMALMTTACTRTTNLSKDPKYAPMIGREFMTQGDYVIMTYSDKSGKNVVHIPGTLGTPELDKLPKQFPYKYEGDSIEGVLPKGSLFKILKIVRASNFENVNEWYTAVVVSDEQFKGWTVDVSFLVKSGINQPPQFNPEYAVEVSTQNR